MNVFLGLFLSLFFMGCNAYRSAPVSEVLFTKQELTKRGFVLAPIADIIKHDNKEPKISVSELDAFDTILANTLVETWKNAQILSTAAVTSYLDADHVESWRKKLEQEDQRASSDATRLVLKELTRLGKSYPLQVLMPSLMQNVVSCGVKDAQPTYLSPNPRDGKTYCQRTMKMRFRVMDNESSELLWNGIIYATQESAVLPNPDGNRMPDASEAPTTQSLVRECFKNFANQFAEK